MSLLVVRTDPGGSRAGASDARIEAALASQRAGRRTRLRWRSGEAVWCGDLDGREGSGAVLVQPGRFAALVGTALWNGRTGAALLEALLARGSDPRRWPLDALLGSFVLLAGDDEAAWLCTDSIGLGKVYSVPEAGVVSTSLMVCREMLDSCRVNRVAAQQYVLLGAAHSLETPLQGVRLLDPAHVHGLAEGLPSIPLHDPRGLRCEPGTAGARDDVARDVADLLVAQFGQMRDAGIERMGVAVTGGFDSRLILALLEAVGSAPDLFVYGRDSDPDVRVAVDVARVLGRPLRVTDKSRLHAAAAPIDEARLALNQRFLDGLPPDGVFDRGADVACRLEQFDGRRANLNGGGGEIFRNFFYLRDRPFSAEDVVDAFYCGGWLPEALPSGDDVEAFRSALALEMRRVLGLPSDRDAASRPLDRQDVELLYPLFRCRYWMGVNNALSARHGAFLTPLVNGPLVARAARLPIAWKSFGAFEGAMIRAISPRVAAVESAYGFPFTEEPSRQHRWKVNSTLVRPIALRRRSTTIRRALGRSPSVPVPEEWGRWVSLDVAADWIRVDRLTSVDQWNRLCTLCALVGPTAAPR